MAHPQNPLRDAALVYARRGWKVFPVHSVTSDLCSCGDKRCQSAGKHPRIKNWVNEATYNLKQIERWWSDWPDANIGIATGRRSNIIVVDEDPKRGGSIDQLLFDCPTQLVVRTGGGGRHAYYKYPEELDKVPNFAGSRGIDVRGDGGLVVAPPSLHASGRRYTWDTENRIGLRGVPGHLPLNVLNMLRETPSGARRGERQVKPSVDAILARGVPEGQRNDTMARLAGRLLRRGLRGDKLRESCLAANKKRFHPPLPEDEVLKVVASIERREKRRRQAEDDEEAEESTDEEDEMGPGPAPAHPTPRVSGPQSTEVVIRGHETSVQAESTAKVLLALAEGVHLFHTPDREAYASFEVAGHRETWPVRSSGFRQWLYREFYELKHKPPSSEALKGVVEVLVAKATIDGPVYRVFVRIAEAKDAIYVDLANDAWEAVEITTSGWRIVADPPVRFRRAKGLLPLPHPVPGGRVDEVRRFINLADEPDDWYLFVAWLVTAVRPTGPYPVLVLQGEQGSAKSTSSGVIREIVDPSSAPLRSEPRSEHDLVIAAGNSWLLAFDNISRIPEWLSDALCRIATGGGFTTRELYTDREEVFFDSQRPITVNGIGDLVVRHDLRDRAIILHLPPVPDEERRDEETFWGEFDAVLPRILGALYQAVSVALRDVAKVQLSVRPRMADAARWATAAEAALGIKAGTMLAALLQKRQSTIEESIEDDPVAAAVSDLAESGPWHGTATELLERLRVCVAEATTKRRDWPQTATALGQRILRLAPALRAIGVEVERYRDSSRNRSRLLLIRPRPSERVRPVRPVHDVRAAADTSDPSDTFPHPSGGGGTLAEYESDFFKDDPREDPKEGA